MAMAQPLESHSERTADLRQVWLLAALLSVVFAAGILLRPAVPIDETRYLSVAWEMHLSGDYFVPTKNGETYAHKPPLLFWLINAVWAVTGVSEAAARLVGPAFAVANLLLTFFLARRLFPDRPEVGPNAAAVLTSFLVYGLYTGLTMFDAMLTTMTLVFLMGAWAALREGRRRGWLICGMALGFGILAKGPVILVHTLPAILLSSLWRKPEITWLQVGKGTLAALGIGVAIAAVWLVPAVVLGGDAYREELLWKQTAGRMANAFDHARPAWFFLALLPLYLFPWSLNLDAWRAPRRVDWSCPAVRMLAVQSVSAVLAFSLIASKQAHYLVPEFPALAILIAVAIGSSKLPARRNLGVVGVALVACLLGLGLFLFGDRLTANWIPENKMIAATLLLALSALTIFVLRLRSPLGTALWTLSFLAVLNLWIAASPLREAYDMHNFTRHFAGRDGADIAFFGRSYDAEFNFVGRLTTPVFEAATREEVVAWAALHGGGLIVAPIAALPERPSFDLEYAESRFGIWDAEVVRQ